jgi:hypothetical protein
MQEEPQVLTNAAAATHLRSLLTQLPRKPPTAPNSLTPTAARPTGTTRPCWHGPLPDDITVHLDAWHNAFNRPKCGRTISTKCGDAGVDHRLAECVLEREPVRVLQPRGQDLTQAGSLTASLNSARLVPSNGAGPNTSRRQSTISAPFEGQHR